LINCLCAFILSTSQGDDCNVSGVTKRLRNMAKKRKVGSNNGNKPLDWYYKPEKLWKLNEEVQAKMLVLCNNRNRAVGTTTSSDGTVATAGTYSSTAAAEP
jgi:hypothetical protein